MSNSQNPPQPPAAPWGPPPPLPPGKKSKAKPVLIGVGAVFVLLVVIGAATGGGKKNSSSDGTATQPAAVTTTQPADAPTTDPPVTDDPVLEDPTTDDPALDDPVTDDPTTPDAPETVTYIVSGSNADVTYGPAGSSLSGHVPMKVTKKLADPAAAYYAISVQLQGGGHASCKLEIDGKVVSQADARGGYNIATCEAVQDPLDGGWVDANSGG